MWSSLILYRLVCECREHDRFFHRVHDQFPQLLQHSLQHRLLADLSEQRQAGTQKHQISFVGGVGSMPW